MALNLVLQTQEGFSMTIGSRLRPLTASLCMSVWMLACSKAGTSHPQAASGGEVPHCAPNQLAGIAPSSEETARHRRFELPVLEYPEVDTTQDWGMPLTLLVDALGRVACYEVKSEFGQPRAMNDRRRDLIKATWAWRYEPFLRDGKPVAAVVSEEVYEERLPGRRRPLPDVPLDQVTISLRRTGCYGTCPAYGVQIQGDGTVIYEGLGFVDVMGKHHYTIPVAQVESLVTDLRRKDLWSMEDSYRARITDNPTYMLTLRMGDQTREIEDYVGSMVGMPQVVREFQDEVDRVGRTAEWTRLSVASVERLREEGFHFQSKEAGDLLVRAIVNEEGDDEQAMLKLIELGAPLHSGKATNSMPTTDESTLFEQVLANHRTMLVEPLIAREALKTDGKPDQYKIDAAFHAAIRGGRLALVQKIWNQAGDGARPSLFFVDEVEDDKQPIRTKSPVTLLLSRLYGDKGWEGRQIAEWLARHGCDLKAHRANGDTLLHIAVDGEDIDFVHYLLAQGVDVSAPGEFDLPALGSTQSEDIALLLLESGSDWQMDDNGTGFLRYASDQHWGRVTAWISNNGLGSKVKN
jgi:Domain of unknown function (DUF6438)